MDTLQEMMRSDARREHTEVDVPSNQGSKELAFLIKKASAYEERIQREEETLKKLKEEHLNIIREQIPDLMMELGVEKMTTSEGATVEVRTLLHARIKGDDKEEAFAWLSDNGLGGIIKNEFKVRFARGEHDEAKKFEETLDSSGIGYSNDESVHHQTLKSTLKELREQGVEFPEKLFGVYEYKEAKVQKSV